MTWLTELLNQYRAEIIVAITGLASLSGGVIVYWVRRKIRSMIDAYIAKKNSDTGILLDIKNRVFPEEKLDNPFGHVRGSHVLSKTERGRGRRKVV